MNRILIVDDDRNIRRIYRRFLMAQGFDVLEAGNGEEATVELLRERDFDLILLDVRMPVVNGTVFFDTVRLYNPEAKVIVTSVYSAEDQKRLIDGADDYYDKATGIRALLAKIRDILQLRVRRDPKRLRQNNGAS